MNLQLLKWTKNVRPDEGWAYTQFKAHEIFKLAWRNDENNANRPQRNDLILLRQHGYVTHLVKVLDRHAEREDWSGDYNIYRIVEVIWSIDNTNPSIDIKADVIFGYSAVLNLQGGNVMKIEDLPTFKHAWEVKGGLAMFQEYVQSKLTKDQPQCRPEDVNICGTN